MSKNLSAKYYRKNKEKTTKKSSWKISNLKKKQKEKKWQYGRERYKNLSEHEKQKLIEYRIKKYNRMRKKCYIIIARKYVNLENFASL